jgi:hypothetical protein
MRRRLAHLRRSAAALALAAVLTAAPGTRAAELAPFEASYDVVWRGVGAGTATLTLKQTGEGAWRYESRNVARGIFRIAVPAVIRQSSELRIEDGKVVPLHFITDDGSESGKRDTEVRFDWDAGRVTGTAEGAKVDIEAVPGLQDTLSIQIAMIQELLAGRTPTGFQMLDRDRVKEYEYLAEGEETLQTAMGEQRTLKFRSQRPGADRGTVFWCAPELGYLPVKVERQRGRKIEWSMTLKSLTR